MKQANQLRQLLIPPPSREHDERMRYIHLLVTRDAFIALMALVILLPLMLQLPAFHSLAKVGMDLLLILALPLVVVVGMISFFLHEGWNRNIKGWRIAILIAVVILMTLGEIVVGLLAPSWSFLLVVLSLIALALAVIFLGQRKQGTSGSENAASHSPARSIPVIPLLIVAVSIVSLLSDFNSAIFTGQYLRYSVPVQFASGIIALILSIMGMLICVARALDIRLPRSLQAPSHLSVEERTIASRNLFMLSLAILAIAIFFLVQAHSPG